jgi:hypothetical protein
MGWRARLGRVWGAFADNPGAFADFPGAPADYSSSPGDYFGAPVFEWQRPANSHRKNLSGFPKYFFSLTTNELRRFFERQGL